LPDDTPDLANVVVLVLDNDRNSCQSNQKGANLAAKGAQFVLFYKFPGFAFVPPPVSSNPNLTEADIEYTAGANIVEAIAAGVNVTVDFSQDFPGVVGAFTSAGGVPSYFTSSSTLYDLTLKPDIAAPGGTIWSTWLNNGYAIVSGTAMATSYVAGVAALYVAATGGRKVHGAVFSKDFMSQVISSGKTLSYASFLQSFPEFNASVDQIGTGLIRADKILTYKTTLAFEKFSLNDTDHFNPQHSVGITNNGDTPITYTFSLQPAGGYEALNMAGGDIFGDTVGLAPYVPLNITPRVSFPSGEFVVQPRRRKVAK
jgi:subtilisin family serine protease